MWDTWKQVRIDDMGVVDELAIELLTQDVDPKTKVKDYVEASMELLRQASIEVDKGDIRQAAEKIWGAVALSVKAYALWRDGRRLSSHRELWEYKDVIAQELGGWVREVFREASTLHICFYEEWCTRQDVVDVLGKVRKLVSTIMDKIH